MRGIHAAAGSLIPFRLSETDNGNDLRCGIALHTLTVTLRTWSCYHPRQASSVLRCMCLQTMRATLPVACRLFQYSQGRRSTSCLDRPDVIQSLLIATNLHHAFHS